MRKKEKHAGGWWEDFPDMHCPETRRGRLLGLDWLGGMAQRRAALDHNLEVYINIVILRRCRVCSGPAEGLPYNKIFGAFLTHPPYLATFGWPR